MSGRTRVLAGVGVVVVLALVLVLVLRSGDDSAGSDGEPAPLVTDDETGAELVPGALSGQPARLPDRGSFVDAQVQPDGTVRVTHWVRAAEGIDELRLATYPALQVPGPTALTDLEITTSQGRVVLEEEPEIGDAPVTLPLLRPSLLVRLGYTVEGVVSDGATVEGRASVDSTFADVDYAGERGTTRVQVGGRQVLSLSCFPDPADVFSQQVCGEGRGAGWAVTLGRQDAEGKVLAQVDLDEPATAESDDGDEG